MAPFSKRIGTTTPPTVALALKTADIIGIARDRLCEAGVVDAVAWHHNAPLFDWLVEHFAFQGISDRAAATYRHEHGQIAWEEVQRGLRAPHLCPSLQSWWHFRCGYRKATQRCSEPSFLRTCDLPKHNLRKGVLNEAAFGLALFIRDICGGDLVAWIDRRLAQADNAGLVAQRGRRMAIAVVAPLAEIQGTGPKIWSMLLADLLLAADPRRERWVAAGASMIAIDTLVHAWLHRTGTIDQHGAAHPYGPRCYAPQGCAEVIERIAQSVDARAFDSSFPTYFPRFIQVAIWEFCAEAGRNICNGRQIDDRYGCRQPFCPAGQGCARNALRNSEGWFERRPARSIRSARSRLRLHRRQHRDRS